MTASSHSSPSSSSSCCRLCSCGRRDRSRLFGGLALLFGDGLGFKASPPIPALAELDLTWPLTALISLLTVKHDILDISISTFTLVRKFFDRPRYLCNLSSKLQSLNSLNIHFSTVNFSTLNSKLSSFHQSFQNPNPKFVVNIFSRFCRSLRGQDEPLTSSACNAMHATLTHGSTTHTERTAKKVRKPSAPRT